MNPSVEFPAAKNPLDLGLFSLSTREITGREMPLSLRRFAIESGMDDPIAAMKRATDSLLEKYFEGTPRVVPPLSVERLCVLCNAELAGARPSARPRSSYASGFRSRKGHTGRLTINGSQVVITIPDEIEFESARISVAHEIGHALIHRREFGYDQATLRLGSSPEEEALAEYAARLLLLPALIFKPMQENNLAEYAVEQAGFAKTTVHASVSRLGDPDIGLSGIRGAILWRIDRHLPKSDPLHKRLTPRWHLCPGEFIPVRRCKARAGSLVAELAEGPSFLSASDIQAVDIGTFSGTFRVDAFAWGSVSMGTRTVLSIFRELT